MQERRTREARLERAMGVEPFADVFNRLAKTVRDEMFQAHGMAMDNALINGAR